MKFVPLIRSTSKADASSSPMQAGAVTNAKKENAAAIIRGVGMCMPKDTIKTFNALLVKNPAVAGKLLSDTINKCKEQNPAPFPSMLETSLDNIYTANFTAIAEAMGPSKETYVEMYQRLAPSKEAYVEMHEAMANTEVVTATTINKYDTMSSVKELLSVIGTFILAIVLAFLCIRLYKMRLKS